MFRLHIDIPLGVKEEDAIVAVNAILKDIDVQKLLRVQNTLVTADTVFQYRLSNDSDRRMNNYLIKDAEGHVSGKKSKIELNK